MKIKTLTIITAVIIGLYSAPAFATEVASIDVQKVVSSSPKVQSLKKEQQAKNKELFTFLEKANKEIAKTTDLKAKEELQNKYSKQLTEKRDKMDKDYASKLEKLEDEISKIIADQAKLKGYDMVVAKGVVLYGTNDITDDVIKAIKSAK